MRKTFRFDDVSINSDMHLLSWQHAIIRKHYPDAEIIMGVSPCVHNDVGERVFPSILNAFSDYRRFYMPDRVGIPDNIPKDKNTVMAGHGLIHVDHRLLHHSAQELSILLSCSLIDAYTFIPPFNKWNKDTESICKENGITLVKFEDGWLSMEHNKNIAIHNLWYVHSRALTGEQFDEWMIDKYL